MSTTTCDEATARAERFEAALRSIAEFDCECERCHDCDNGDCWSCLAKAALRPIARHRLRGGQVSNNLLPCPFCGFHAQLREYCNDRPDANHDLRWYVHCPGCGTEGAMHGGQAVAVTAWNRRVQLECGWCRQDTMCNHRAKYGHCALGDDPEKCLACPGER